MTEDDLILEAFKHVHRDILNPDKLNARISSIGSFPLALSLPTDGHFSVPKIALRRVTIPQDKLLFDSTYSFVYNGSVYVTSDIQLAVCLAYNTTSPINQISVIIAGKSYNLNDFLDLSTPFVVSLPSLGPNNVPHRLKSPMAKEVQEVIVGPNKLPEWYLQDPFFNIYEILDAQIQSPFLGPQKTVKIPHPCITPGFLLAYNSEDLVFERVDGEDVTRIIFERVQSQSERRVAMETLKVEDTFSDIDAIVLKMVEDLNLLEHSSDTGPIPFFENGGSKFMQQVLHFMGFEGDSEQDVFTKLVDLFSLMAYSDCEGVSGILRTFNEILSHSHSRITAIHTTNPIIEAESKGIKINKQGATFQNSFS